MLVGDWVLIDEDGQEPVKVPHVWGEEVPVAWEGPRSYACTVHPMSANAVLRFHGVSYHAEVLLNGKSELKHDGMWDAFDVPLGAHAGTAVDVEVRVIKNGGETYPTKEVASGFIPYVFHTFGGIHGAVELLENPEPLGPAAPEPRIERSGVRLTYDGKPYYMRGILHWGWYPTTLNPFADEATIRRECEAVRDHGFNLVKFCLWLPPHRYLEILDEMGLTAWIELPLWLPTGDEARQKQIAEEFERIVRQFRRHSNVVAWTVGCELSHSTSAEYREKLVKLVKDLTGCPLVKDNSGGAEMYGGDLREFGDFYDYHPYCDTQFYPQVLDILQNGPRDPKPILLGEYNDIDVHRDLARVVKESPYWASADPHFNDKGVRWQYDLPGLLPTNRFAQAPLENGHSRLMEESAWKSVFIRRTVTEMVRSQADIAGYVITGFRDTPISTAGILDDWGNTRFEQEEFVGWNAPDVFFPIRTRRPPWVNGGNRPGYSDPWNHFVGQVYLRIGASVTEGRPIRARWSIVDTHGDVVAEGQGGLVEVDSLAPRQVLEIAWTCDQPGAYSLAVEGPGFRSAWPIWVVEKPDLEGWIVNDPGGFFNGAPFQTQGTGYGHIATRPGDRPTDLLFLVDDMTKPVPFWRESAYEFRNDEFWDNVPFKDRWERLLPISGDRVIDVDAFARRYGRDFEVLMNRIDVRTYEEAPVLVRCGGGFATTLRPFGGLGIQPTSLMANPAGCAFVQALIEQLVR